MALNASSHIVGHGVALGRFVDDDEPRFGPDEDELTVAVEAGAWALARASAPPIKRVVIDVAHTAANDDAVAIAALRLGDEVPVLRVDGAFEALTIAMDAEGPTLILAATPGQAGAVVVADVGYGNLSTARRLVGGAAISDPRRDPRFARVAGGRGLARQLGAAAQSRAPLVDLAAALETQTSITIVGGNNACAIAIDVEPVQSPPPGPTVHDWRQAAHRGARPAPPIGTRPRGATGVDPDGPLLWRERRELLVPLGARCLTCRAVNAPTAGAVLCRACGNRDLEIIELERRGTVVTYCVSSALPESLCAPLSMIYAELDDGVLWKALGSGLDESTLEIGARVELVLRRLGFDDTVPIYGLAFRRPLDQECPVVGASA